MLFNSWGTDEERRLQRMTALIRMALSVGNSKRLNQYMENFLQWNKHKNEGALYK